MEGERNSFQDEQRRVQRENSRTVALSQARMSVGNDANESTVLDAARQVASFLEKDDRVGARSQAIAHARQSVGPTAPVDALLKSAETFLAFMVE